MKIEYQLLKREEVDGYVRDVFALMLEKQGKVRGKLQEKADRCKLLCVAKIDNRPVAIGGIKVATKDDFSQANAGLPELRDSFEWELGYLFTEKEYEGQGIASNVVRCLLRGYGNGNLMASTEISANPNMVRILEKRGFRLFGKPWESGIHGNYLGLFLRFE